MFAIANALADVIICIPPRDTLMHLQPKEYLVCLARVLGPFRGGNNVLLPILQNRLMECGLGVPKISRVTDVTDMSSGSDRREDRSNSDGSIDWIAEDNSSLVPEGSLCLTCI